MRPNCHLFSRVCVQLKGTVFNQCLAILTTYRKCVILSFKSASLACFSSFMLFSCCRKVAAVPEVMSMFESRKKRRGEIAYASYTYSPLWGKAKLPQKSRVSFVLFAWPVKLLTSNSLWSFFSRDSSCPQCLSMLISISGLPLCSFQGYGKFGIISDITLVVQMVKNLPVI